jgi:hypothetical protein
MITPEEPGKGLRQACERFGIKQDEDATAIAKIAQGKRGVGALEGQIFVCVLQCAGKPLLIQKQKQ